METEPIESSTEPSLVPSPTPTPIPSSVPSLTTTDIPRRPRSTPKKTPSKSSSQSTSKYPSKSSTKAQPKHKSKDKAVQQSSHVPTPYGTSKQIKAVAAMQTDAKRDASQHMNLLLEGFNTSLEVYKNLHRLLTYTFLKTAPCSQVNELQLIETDDSFAFEESKLYNIFNFPRLWDVIYGFNKFALDYLESQSFTRGPLITDTDAGTSTSKAAEETIDAVLLIQDSFDPVFSDQQSSVFAATIQETPVSVPAPQDTPVPSAQDQRMIESISHPTDDITTASLAPDQPTSRTTAPISYPTADESQLMAVDQPEVSTASPVLENPTVDTANPSTPEGFVEDVADDPMMSSMPQESSDVSSQATDVPHTSRPAFAPLIPTDNVQVIHAVPDSKAAPSSSSSRRQPKQPHILPELPVEFIEIPRKPRFMRYDSDEETDGRITHWKGREPNKVTFKIPEGAENPIQALLDAISDQQLEIEKLKHKK
ncbi:endochitinase A-like [Salvia miltiorrhiza]|uniref:endochitinase A-like n=1 Tax=Salvia miltiorrhiza TaxID=226208 RepID=UPI0025AC2380|nr:endochitinase A-like [Salvia miltiorrhiza]